MISPFSRRALLGGAIGALGASLLPKQARAAGAQRKAVAVVYLAGGFNAMHCVPDALRGTFSTSDASMLPTGTGLFVDKATFGQFSASTLQRMGVVGVQHGITAHDPAISAIFTGASSYPLTLAASMPSDAALRCARVSNFPSNASFGAVPGASMTSVKDVRSALDLMVGANRPGEPARGAMAKGLRLSYTLSKSMIEQNPRTLSPHASGYDTLIGALEKPVRPLDWGEIATSYGLDGAQTTIDSNPGQFASAELVIRGGGSVVMMSPGADRSCGEAGWDTHGDESGNCLRNMMNATLTRHLSTFLDRTLAMTDVDVTTVVLGEFSRDPYLSDHARCLSAAIFSNRVKPVVSGRPIVQDNYRLSMPDGTPGIKAMWALIAELAGVTTSPFGANPHAMVL